MAFLQQLWHRWYRPALKGTPNQQIAGPAMLELLIEFSKLDDAGFNLLTAYSEQDAQIENQSVEEPKQATSHRLDAIR